MRIILTPTCSHCPYSLGESDSLVEGKGKVFCFPKEEVLTKIQLLNFCPTARAFEDYLSQGAC
ncbi:hypothetical protein [Methanosarcina siciliae]|uniref:hypothetical protein n=1 Tax=Methanosarcina siciliae TaxID=38027 RepID=UPI00064F5947|nr:hypothetical protein [Methanosarcina siciliae]